MFASRLTQPSCSARIRPGNPSAGRNLPTPTAGRHIPSPSAGTKIPAPVAGARQIRRYDGAAA